MRPLTRIFLSLCLLLGFINSATLSGQAQPRRSTQITAEPSQPNTGAGRYVSLATPTRMLDTGTANVVDPQEKVPVKFTGRNGIPATGVTAVQLNIVAGNTSATGAVFAWPADEAQPAPPIFYFPVHTGFTSSTTILRLSASGEATILNGSQGTLRLLADVTGYYTGADSQVAGSRFVPLRQARVADTRTGTGAPVPANGNANFTIASKGGLPAASAISAVALSITARDAKANGGWIAYPFGGTVPSAYFGNFIGAGRPYTNSAIVKLSADGTLGLRNVSSGTTHFTVDVVGYFIADTSPAAASVRTVPIKLQRVLDTGASTLVSPNSVSTVQVSGTAGIPATGVHFVALRVTAMGSATSGEVVAYPAGETRPPGVTDVAAPIAGRHSDNLIWARVSAAGTVSLVNGTNAGLRLYVDVQAYGVFPGKPQAPVAITGGSRDGAIEVHWDAPADTGDLAIAGYDVVAAPGSATATSTSTSVVISGLANGTVYTFRVRARTAAGASAYSEPSGAITPAAPKAPGAPFITSVVPRDTGARVSWVAPEDAVDQVASYEISTVPTSTTVVVDGGERVADIYGLVNEQTYSVVVTAKNSNGAGTSAGERVTPAPAELPMKPADFQLYPLNDRVDLQWVEPADGGSPILDYEVVAEPGAHRLVIPAGTTVAALLGLVNGTAYDVKVRARTKVGSGDWVEGNATPAASRAPDAPTDLQVSPLAPGTLKVSWKAPDVSGTSAVTGYRVTVSPGDRVIQTTGLTADVAGLAPETEYTVSVQAVNAAGVSDATAPSPPTNPDVVLRKTPVVLSADSLARLADVGDGHLTFSSPNAQISALKNDDIVIVTPVPVAPGGLLRKVLRVDSSGSVLVAQTEDSALEEVLTEGSVARDVTMRGDDVESLENALPGVTLKHPTINGRSLRDGAGSAVQPASRSAKAGARTAKIQLHKTKVVISLDADFGKAVNLEGTAEADLRTDLNFGVRSGKIFTHFRPTVDTKIDVRARIAFTQQFERRVQLGSIPGPPIVIPAGPAPVSVQPRVAVYLSWDSEGRAGLQLHAEVSRRLGADVKFVQGMLVPLTTPINEPLKPYKETVTAFGSSENSLGIGVDLAVQLFGIIGPTATIRPYVKLEADTDNDPFVQLFLGVQFGAGLRLDFLKKDILRWTKDDIVQIEYRIADSGGPFAGLMIEPGGVAMAPGEKLKFTSRISRYPDAPATWSAEGAGRIDPDGTFTALREGTAKVKAQVPAGVGRPALTAEVPVLLGQHAPSQPGNVSAVPGNLSAHVSWTPPQLPGGSPVTGYVVTTEPDTGVHRVSSGTLNTTITGLRSGTQYRASVYAVTNNGKGDAGTSAPFTARSSGLANPKGNDLMAGITGSSNDIGPELSDTGRYVFFPLRVAPGTSGPSGVPADGNFYLVRREIATGAVELASRQADGATPQIISAPKALVGNWDPVQKDVSSSAEGRSVAYIVDDGGGRRRVMVYDFVQHTVWSAGIGDEIFAIRLSGSGTVVAAMTATQDANNQTQGKVYRVVIGGGAQRVDTCTSAAVCDSAYLRGVSADGNTVIYTMTVRNAQSPHYGKTNLHVFYRATTGASEMPYYNSGLSFGPLVTSRNGQYFAAAANLGSEWALVAKQVGTGQVTTADVFQRGYEVFPGFPLAINDNGSTVAWIPGAGSGAEPPGRFTQFMVTNRTTGVKIGVSDAGWPPGVTDGTTGIGMSADGSMVAWQPQNTVSPDYERPTGQQIR